MATVITDNVVATGANTVAVSPRPWLKWISLALALGGAGITGYLTYSHLTETATACPANATFNCELVQHSIYSELAGIPIAYIGLAGYLAILVVLLLEGRIPFFTQRGSLLVFGFTLFGFLYSGFLTSTEAFVLHAWCLWCLSSAILMTVLFAISAGRAWRKMGMVDDSFDDELEEGDAA
jgi:uncharacterized membrane protein